MKLYSKIIQRRNVGRTTCATTPISEPVADIEMLVNDVARAHGFHPPETGWTLISGADAHAIVTALLHRDLGSQTEIMPVADAADFATQFLDLAPEPHTYFTNATWTTVFDAASPAAVLSSWNPISNAAFDSGVICVGDGVAAILWVEDED